MKYAYLADIGEFKNGVNFESNRMGHGVPLINVKDITISHRINVDDLDLVEIPISEDRIAKDGDIFFVRSSVKLDGIALAAKLLPSDRGTVHCGFIIRFRPTHSDVDSDYLLYLLRGREYRERLKKLSGGTAIVNISQAALRTLNVPLPPIASQKRIASILSAYDDLIENNRRRIQLLEQAARLLYKEWFVHLRFPGHEHVKIKNGVPEGWEKTSVGEMSSLISRGITPKYDDEAESVVINQKCIRNRLVTLDQARRQSKEVPLDKLLQFGDVLINSTGEGTLGRVAQLYQEVKNCTVDSHVTIVRPKAGISILLFGQQLILMEDHLATMGRGATNQTELSRTTIAELPFLLPTRVLGEEFEQITTGIVRQLQTLLQQKGKLAEVRDLLLPRLMNGEIRA